MAETADIEQGMSLTIDRGCSDAAMIPVNDAQHGRSSVFESAAATGGAFIPVSLSFTHISYKVAIGKGKRAKDKMILTDVSGYVRPGSFVAIMGPSGSGKTSLLNVLAGRVARSAHISLEGEVLVNGKPRDKSFRRMSAYVMQDDLLFSALTVWETVQTAAMLRLPSSISRARKKELAEGVVQELGLSKARDTYIGSAILQGVSGGERKRCNIAVEMLGNPSLVFLDEPTSGLDSFQALNVMSALSDLANSGRTVISTIHQPRSSIFSLFENLLLLCEGRMAYFGAASASIDYFHQLGFNCPPHYNPADYYMDIISVDSREASSEAESTNRIARILEAYQPDDNVRPDLHQQSLAEQANAAVAAMTGWPSSWATQWVVLARRAFWQVTRDRLPLIIAYVQVLVMTFLISVLYYGGGSTSQETVQNFQGALFFMSVFLSFNGIFQIITTLPHERFIINRERSSNTYRLSAYYLSKVLTEWPFRIAPIILFCSIVYWPVHLQRTVAKFLLFTVNSVLEYTAMNAVGLLIGAAAPSPETALALGPLLVVLFILFAGLFANINSIPVWIRWIHFLSPIQWGFAGFVINQFTGWTYDCPQPNTSGCIPNGEIVINNLSLGGYTIGECFAYQCCLILGMHCLAFIALYLNGPKIQSLTALAKGPAAAAAAVAERKEGDKNKALEG